MKKKPGRNAAILPGDLALVHVEHKPAFFSRVESIDPDHKRGWWRVKLLVLNLPLKVATWVLDNDQICGGDFTMGGVPVRLEKIVAPEAEEPDKTDLRPQVGGVQRQAPEAGRPARILSFKRRQESDDTEDI
jgi:hypothetical protein